MDLAHQSGEAVDPGGDGSPASERGQGADAEEQELIGWVVLNEDVQFLDHPVGVIGVQQGAEVVLFDGPALGVHVRATAIGPATAEPGQRRPPPQGERLVEPVEVAGFSRSLGEAQEPVVIHQHRVDIKHEESRA